MISGVICISLLTRGCIFTLQTLIFLDLWKIMHLSFSYQRLWYPSLCWFVLSSTATQMGSRRCKEVRHKDKWGFMHNIRIRTARPSMVFVTWTLPAMLHASLFSSMLVCLAQTFIGMLYQSYKQKIAASCHLSGTKRGICKWDLKITYGYITFVYSTVQFLAL